MRGHASPNYLPVRPEWLAAGHEEPLRPELPIVDAHHHLWDRPGWRYLFEEYVADIRAGGHRVLASVYMQAQTLYRADGPPAFKVIGETEFASGVAAMAARGHYGPTRICAGIVGHADLTLGAADADVLDAHLRAGGDRFRGIRHLTTWDADASLTNPLSAGPRGLLADTAFRAGFACLAPRGLSYDAWLFHPQLDELTDPARAFPTTTIVTFALIGTISARTVFYTIPQSFLTGAAAAGGLAFINSVGAFGGFVGPYLVGYLKDATGSFNAGMLGMAAILLASVFVAGSLKLVIRNA